MELKVEIVGFLNLFAPFSKCPLQQGLHFGERLYAHLEEHPGKRSPLHFSPSGADESNCLPQPRIEIPGGQEAAV